MACSSSRIRTLYEGPYSYGVRCRKAGKPYFAMARSRTAATRAASAAQQGARACDAAIALAVARRASSR